MGTSERIENVAKIIVEDASERKVAVVSAMSKVTDMMYGLLHKAQARDESYIAALDAVHTKHKDTAVALLGDGDDLKDFLAVLEADILNLRAMLRAICIGLYLSNSLADCIIMLDYQQRMLFNMFELVGVLVPPLQLSFLLIAFFSDLKLRF